MSHKIYKRGFTLIELLVVIAIIGILAGIVLAAVGTTRQKGADAGVSGNIAGLRTAAEVFAAANGNSYSGFCASTATQKSLLQAATDAGYGAGAVQTAAAGNLAKVTCNDSATAWAAEAPVRLSTGVGTYMWCADSQGFSSSTVGVALTAAGTVKCY